MTTADSSVPSLLARLERLERANRRFKLAGAGLGLTLFAWTACSVAPQVENQLAAERLVLLAADGSEKAALELDSKGNPMLTLRHEKASAILTTNGPSLLLRGADGKTGAYMGVDSRNTSRLELCSHRLQDGVRLVAHEDGSSGAYVLDQNGRARGALEHFSTGGAALNLSDGQGRQRAHLGLDAGNLPSVILLDEGGGRRVGMLVQASGHALLELADDQGRSRAELSTRFDGSPLLQMKGEDGSATFEAP